MGIEGVVGIRPPENIATRVGRGGKTSADGGGQKGGRFFHRGPGARKGDMADFEEEKKKDAQKKKEPQKVEKNPVDEILEMANRFGLGISEKEIGFGEGAQEDVPAADNTFSELCDMAGGRRYTLTAEQEEKGGVHREEFGSQKEDKGKRPALSMFGQLRDMVGSVAGRFPVLRTGVSGGGSCNVDAGEMVNARV